MSGFGFDPIPGMKTPELSGTNPAATPVHQAAAVADSPLKGFEIRITNGPASGRTVRLTPAKLVIGRNDPPDVMVDIDLTDAELGSPPMVSRRHATIAVSDNKVSVVDLGSTNGTFVSGKKIEANCPTTCPPGAHIRVANLDMEVVVD